VSGVLVDYRCSDCGVLAEHRFPSPAPSAVTCSRCGGESRRKYGFRVGASAGASPSAPATGHGHDHVDGLGTCGLLPTAVRALTARLSGDERGLEREFKSQERMISEGTLDPKAGVHGLKKPEAAAPGAPAAAPVA
jgi:hypothetical protein